MNDTPQSRHRVSMTDQEEKERRFSIQAIMKDPNLSPLERRKSIQSLMDGRRRSSMLHLDSNVESKRVSLDSSMALTAAYVASSFADEDDSLVSKKRSSVNPNQESPQSPGNEQLFKRNSSFRDDNDTVSSSACMPSASARRMEKSRPPCGHYQRNCSIVSPCCGLVFGCRICHNDAHDLPPPFSTSHKDLTYPSYVNGGALDVAGPDPLGATVADPKIGGPAVFPHRRSSLLSSSDDESHHEIDRFGIKEVICRECFTRQSSKT